MSYQNADLPRARFGIRLGRNLTGRNLRALQSPALRLLRRYGLLVGVLLFWEISATQEWINNTIFPAPSVISVALYQGLVHGNLLQDVTISLQRSGLAYLSALLLGIPLGLAMGQIRAVEEALDPVLQLFRQTSALALYPVFVLLLGLGEASKVFVIFWGTFFPILLSTIGGVKEVDRKLIEMAHSYGASRLMIFRRVILPAATPSIFVGLRLSATGALLMLVAAEMIGANRGLGFQVQNAQYNFQVPLMFAAIALLALLGLATNALLLAIQRYMCRWADAGR